jgi:hypothetical protein
VLCQLTMGSVTLDGVPVRGPWEDAWGEPITVCEVVRLVYTHATRMVSIWWRGRGAVDLWGRRNIDLCALPSSHDLAHMRFGVSMRWGNAMRIIRSSATGDWLPPPRDRESPSTNFLLPRASRARVRGVVCFAAHEHAIVATPRACSQYPMTAMLAQSLPCRGRNRTCLPLVMMGQTCRNFSPCFAGSRFPLASRMPRNASAVTVYLGVQRVPQMQAFLLTQRMAPACTIASTAQCVHTHTLELAHTQRSKYQQNTNTIYL